MFALPCGPRIVRARYETKYAYRHHKVATYNISGIRIRILKDYYQGKDDDGLLQTGGKQLQTTLSTTALILANTKADRSHWTQ